MTINRLITLLENIRNERGNVNVLVDQLDKYGECEGLTKHIHIDWDDDYKGLRIGCEE